MRVLKVMAMITFGITSPKWLQLSRLQCMSNRPILFQFTVESHHTTTSFIFFQPKCENHWIILLLEDPVSNVMTSLLWPGFYGPIMVTLTEFHCIIKIYKCIVLESLNLKADFFFFYSPQAFSFNTLKLVLWKTLISGKNWNY